MLPLATLCRLLSKPLRLMPTLLKSLTRQSRVKEKAAAVVLAAGAAAVVPAKAVPKVKHLFLPAKVNEPWRKLTVCL